MPPAPNPHRLSWSEIGSSAVKFSKDWAHAKSEKSQAQNFIRAFLGVFRSNGIVGEFEKPIKTADGATNWIDFYWKGRIAIEMKSRGKSLDDAYNQLKGYMETLPPEDVPALWMVSDFESIRIYQTEKPEHRFATAKLKKHVRHFAILAGHCQEDIRTDKESVNIQAAERMAGLHEALKASGYQGNDLQAYISRLLFCLFADDTGIFPQDSFFRYIEESREDGRDLHSRLTDLFQALDERVEDRVEDPGMTAFQYVNGGLFKGQLRRAVFSQKMRQTILDCLAFDWGQISPAIFGSMFQGVMEGVERREIGAHYTSEENILKLIDPLFMDDLRAEFAAARKKASYQGLAELHDKIAGLKFLDPACGCGNFLIIAYRELRRLELGIVRAKRAMRNGNGPKRKAQKGITKRTKGIDHAHLDIGAEFRVAIEQFHGIEILPWPCQLARTGMWLMDHMMNMEASDELGQPYNRLPLTEGASIVEGNALEIDWGDIVPMKELNYIMGNPPFAGARLMSAEQKGDMARVFGDTKNLGNLDYVTAWYRKAADIIGHLPIKAAFVSTNSISQGEQAALLWRPLMEQGMHINFGVPTFKWTNEAKGKAAVHCVIVGFSNQKTEPSINPYLIEGPTVFIERRNRPLCNVPELSVGNQVIDDGNYLFTDAEKVEFLKKEPAAKKWFRRWVSSDEFINGWYRHFLFIRNCPPNELRKMPECMKRVEAVRKFRNTSNTISHHDCNK